MRDIELSSIAHCCGATAWQDEIQKKILLHKKDMNLNLLQSFAQEIWLSLSESDWLEAFACHPKIGDISRLREKFSTHAHWSKGEQSSVSDADDLELLELKNKNDAYELKFGFIFIVCATGKSVKEMLNLLNERMSNLREDELKIAANEQLKIMNLRLEKLWRTI